ncbi:GNAT family N-acetyltransferase [Aestuariibaculum suncheonense]|uniref:GNAT family N-acetyltransferase n=1 Tax=Aestuariibaculum suncheonense TaxID=1028745 RepID=A0A8J6Q532_9FLAO|nr:GNAT family N-acetyltransferase [Aestuariibaculum suncheonense]MBD0834040.1 GNAT family N-acetyltransferase [Aestuariibaculum suncheonense]
MITLLRTTSTNNDFIALVKLLDTDLAKRDDDDHAFYAQFNKIDSINYVVVAYKDNVPIACGAIKPCNSTTMEIKRMYTAEDYRGKGIASLVLAELEQWASQLSYTTCILETGIKQPEAIKLYEKNGYQNIPNYGQYADVSESKCFEKHLN